MNKLIAILTLGFCSFVFAASNVEWSKDRSGVSVAANKSAKITTGCTSYRIAPGEWNENGKPMDASVHHSRPTIEMNVKVKAQVLKNGSLKVTIGNNKPFTLAPGPMTAIIRCPMTF